MNSEVQPGCTKLIAALDEAVVAGDHVAITCAVEKALCRLIANHEVSLPAPLSKPDSAGYARRLIHHDSVRGYTALAMVWGSGQETPVHDHDGLWCVEGVLEGQIKITQYDLKARDGVRYQFEAQPPITAGVGSAGRLIPPYDYHTIANPDATHKAVTIHVYGGEMEQCGAYLPLQDGWYQRETRQLRYTAA